MTVASKTFAVPAIRRGLFYLRTDPGSRYGDRGQQVLVIRPGLRVVENDAFAGEDVDGLPIELEVHSLDRRELGQRVYDLGEAHHRREAAAAGLELRAEINGGDAVLDRDVEELRPLGDRGRDSRRRLHVGRAGEERLERRPRHSGRRRHRPRGAEEQRPELDLRAPFTGERPGIACEPQLEGNGLLRLGRCGGRLRLGWGLRLGRGLRGGVGRRLGWLRRGGRAGSRPFGLAAAARGHRKGENGGREGKHERSHR